MISYDRLWQTMRDRGVTQYALIKTYHISPGQITRLKRNESVSTHTIDTFCQILRCRVEDVMTCCLSEAAAGEEECGEPASAAEEQTEYR